MKYFFLLLLVGSIGSAYGQMTAPNAASLGMGHATVAMPSAISLFNNQAGLAGLTKIAIVASAERRFLLSELQNAAVGVAFPTRSGSFGFTVQSYGFEDFRQQKFGLSYARRLWKTLSVGAQFDYFQTRIPEYGSSGIITFEAGVQAAISKTLTLGAHVFSPAQVELAAGENLPTILRMGIAWKLSEKLQLGTEIEKSIDYKPRWKTGLSYQPTNPLFLRAGFATEPSMLFFGLGFAFGNGFQADMSGSFHQTLGFTPSAGLQWN